MITAFIARTYYTTGYKHISRCSESFKYRRHPPRKATAERPNSANIEDHNSILTTAIPEAAKPQTHTQDLDQDLSQDLSQDLGQDLDQDLGQDLSQDLDQDLELTANVVDEGQGETVVEHVMIDEPLRTWDCESTLQLINAYRNFVEVFSRHLHLKKEISAEITRHLQQLGLRFQAVQVEGRWKTLTTAYRRALVLNRQASGSTEWRFCRYFNELQSILGDGGVQAAGGGNMAAGNSGSATGGGEVADGAESAILHPASSTTASSTTVDLASNKSSVSLAEAEELEEEAVRVERKRWRRTTAQQPQPPPPQPMLPSPQLPPRQVQ